MTDSSSNLQSPFKTEIITFKYVRPNHPKRSSLCCELEGRLTEGYETILIAYREAIKLNKMRLAHALTV